MKATKLESNEIDLWLDHHAGNPRTKEQIQESIECEKEELERQRKYKELVKKREEEIFKLECEVEEIELTIESLIYDGNEGELPYYQYIEAKHKDDLPLRDYMEENYHDLLHYDHEKFDFEFKKAILNFKIDYLNKEKSKIQNDIDEWQIYNPILNTYNGNEKDLIKNEK